jgi:hypothetical protein
MCPCYIADLTEHKSGFTIHLALASFLALCGKRFRLRFLLLTAGIGHTLNIYQIIGFYLSVCLSIYLSIYLSIVFTCLPIYCLSIYYLILGLKKKRKSKMSAVHKGAKDTLQ